MEHDHGLFKGVLASLTRSAPRKRPLGAFASKMIACAAGGLCIPCAPRNKGLMEQVLWTRKKGPGPGRFVELVHGALHS